MAPDTTPSDLSTPENNKFTSDNKGTATFKWAKEKIGRQQYKSTISKHKIGLEWDEEQLNGTDEVDSGHSPKNTVIDIKEKQFRTRFSYFAQRTLLKTVSFALAITAPITFPWLFKFIIPDLMALLPASLAKTIQDTIDSIHSFLDRFSWIEPMLDIIMQLAATFNPFLVYMALMWALNSSEIVHDESYEDPLADTSDIPSSADYFASDLQLKFALSFSEMAVLLFLISCCVSVFLVIGRERGVIYELMTTKELKKHLEEIEKAFVGYYKDKGYEEANYIKNRVSESPKLISLAYLVKFSPLISCIIPVILVVIMLIL